ncbi:hypothetical protein BGX38DRAFT_1144049 [Terfezia claveryi]|nr:hypothetical protein BGX38DRAFT_1144049 [Terfezia claveryi]
MDNLEEGIWAIMRQRQLNKGSGLQRQANHQVRREEHRVWIVERERLRSGEDTEEARLSWQDLRRGRRERREALQLQREMGLSFDSSKDTDSTFLPTTIDAERMDVDSQTLDDLVQGFRSIDIRDSGLPQRLFIDNGANGARSPNHGNPIVWREQRPGKQVVLQAGNSLRIVGGAGYNLASIPEIQPRTNPHLLDVQFVLGVAFQDKHHKGVKALHPDARMPEVLILFT